jgi:micrococcal nuclease
VSRTPRRLLALCGVALMAGLAGCGSHDSGPAPVVPDAPAPPRDAFLATVERVVDGDTLVARRDGQRVRVRLIGIDAPESVQPDAPVECFGPESARALADLVPPGTRVTAAYQGVPEHDQYGRELWDMWVDGRLVQAELVSRGTARARVYRPQAQYAELLRALGESARQAHVGLFARCPA